MIRIDSYSVFCDATPTCLSNAYNGAANREEALAYALKKGWLKVGRRHFCPDCAAKQPVPKKRASKVPEKTSDFFEGWVKVIKEL